MKEPKQSYERLDKTWKQLKAIRDEREAAVTIIGGDEFDNEEWVEAERQALQERRKRLAETITPKGEFAGLER